MANNWGQGSNNNIIGWGQGTVNNSIGWGDSHYVSYAADTDIIGLAGVVNKNFQERVIADSGTFEGIECSANSLISINNIETFIAPLDAATTAFLSATAITDATITSAIDALVIGLKADGIWSKMKAIYPFVGGTATTHKFNLVNAADTDAAFRLAFSGGWSHSSNGATPNKINGFANTFVIPSINLTNDSTHLSFYSRTNISSNEVDMGVKVDNPIRFNLEIRYFGNLSSDQYTYLTGRVNVVNTDSSGYFVATRASSSSHKVFRNSNQIGLTNTGASLGLSLLNLPIYIGTSNGSGAVYSSKQVAFSTIGDGLSDTEASNLYTRVQAFQTTLGRQV